MIVDFDCVQFEIYCVQFEPVLNQSKSGRKMKIKVGAAQLLRKLLDQKLVDLEVRLIILCAQVLLDLLRVAVGRILPDIRRENLLNRTKCLSLRHEAIVK